MGTERGQEEERPPHRMFVDPFELGVCAEALRKGPVVVYFFPAAHTGGCNLEAHTFAKNKAKFDLVGATIIGVSRDSIKQLNDFSSDQQYCAGKFPVASDPDGAIAQSYDLQVMNLNRVVKTTRGEDVDYALTERTTFVITPDSKLVATLSWADDKITPVEHVERPLAIVEGLRKK